MTLREFEERLEDIEDLEWLMAIEEIEPQEDHWVMNANIITLIYNYIREKGERAIGIGDVYMHLGSSKPKDDGKLNEAKWIAYAHVHNAMIRSKQKKR